MNHLVFFCNVDWRDVSSFFIGSSEDVYFTSDWEGEASSTLESGKLQVMLDPV